MLIPQCGLSSAECKRPALFKVSRYSVHDLVDDPHSLAGGLSEIARLPPSERPSRLRLVVRPELEIVGAQSACSATGFGLLDVWRYSLHITDDLPLPAGYAVGKPAFARIKHNIWPWDLDILAREVVMNAATKSTRSTVSASARAILPKPRLPSTVRAPR